MNGDPSRRRSRGYGDGDRRVPGDREIRRERTLKRHPVRTCEALPQDLHRTADRPAGGEEVTHLWNHAKWHIAREWAVHGKHFDIPGCRAPTDTVPVSNGSSVDQTIVALHHTGFDVSEGPMLPNAAEFSGESCNWFPKGVFAVYWMD